MQRTRDQHDHPIHRLRFVIEDGDSLQATIECPFDPFDENAPCAQFDDVESVPPRGRIPGCAGQVALDVAAAGDIVHGTVEYADPDGVPAEVAWDGTEWIILVGKERSRFLAGTDQPDGFSPDTMESSTRTSSLPDAPFGPDDACPPPRMSWVDDPRVKAAMRSALEEIDTKIAMADFAATANGPHVCIAFDPETFDPDNPASLAGAITVSGLLANFLEADTEARASETELNRGVGGIEHRFVVFPAPVWPAQRDGEHPHRGRPA